MNFKVALLRTPCVLLILNLYALGAQNVVPKKIQIDSVAFKTIADLEERGDNDGAALAFVEYLETELPNESRKNDFAAMVYRYAAYQQTLTKNPELRKRYFDVLIDARSQSQPLDTLNLITAYYTAANDADQMITYRSNALEYINKGIDVWEKYYKKPTDLYAQMNAQKAQILAALMYSGESFDWFEKTVKIYESVENPDNMFLFAFYKNISGQFSKYGFYEKAELYLQKAVIISKMIMPRLKKIEEDRDQLYLYSTEIYSIFANLFYNSEQEEKLLKTIKDLEDFCRGKQLSTIAQFYRANVYSSAGLFYTNKAKDDAKGLFYFEKALELIPKNFIQTYVDYFELNVAKSKSLLGLKDEAMVVLNDLEKRNLSKRLRAFLAGIKGEILVQRGQIREALPSYNLVINHISLHTDTLNILSDSIVRDYKPSKNLYEAQQLLLSADEFLKVEKQTDTTLNLANNLYRLALKHFNNAYTKTEYNEKLESIYNNILKGVFKTNKMRFGNAIPNENLFEDIINRKSSFLWHSFLVNRDIEGLNIPDSLVAKEKEYGQRLAFFQTQLKEVKIDSLLQFKIRNLNEKLNSLKDKIRSEYVSYNYFDTYQFSLEKLRTDLNQETVVLNYQVLDDKLMLYALTRDNLEVIDLGNYSDVENAIKSYLNLIKDINQSKANILMEGSKIVKLLGLESLNAYSKLVVIPDRIIHYVPFDALTLNNDYLIKEKEVSYAISIPFVNYQGQTKTRGKNPLIYSPSYTNSKLETRQVAFRDAPNSLEGTKKEALNVSEIIGGTLFNGASATKASFIGEAENATILHLAMHAFLDEYDINLSNLLFTNEVEDYKLYISELYGLNLKADLAVLSACNTGVGQEKLGTGMISLNRAFTYAGVPTTIASQWSVPDKSTEVVITNFYNNLSSGLSTSKALRKAKLSFLNSPTTNNKLLHPIFWAGLVHQGKDANIKISNSRDLWYVLGLAAFVILIIGFIIRYKRKQMASA